MKSNLVYMIPTEKFSKNEIIDLLKNHPEIKFASLVGIDLAGNDTDEKIPIHLFLKNMEDFFTGSMVQTDGSSVVLTGLATLNNAKVDMHIDPNVNWFVDYNMEHIDSETCKPIGTLRIPSFLYHDNLRVDSRSILEESLEYVKAELLSLLTQQAVIIGLEHINGEEIEDIIFTVGTELEFWVKTPAQSAHFDELSASQVLQENYWQRTRGSTRTAMEKVLLELGKYGIEPEMGHKEVGGVKSRIGEAGGLCHVMEQLEIDWRFSTAMQAADNELQVRIIIKEIFREHGLEVIFKAKPIIGVAGSGKHTHVGIAGKLKSGKLVNLFAPIDMKKNFLSAFGYGAIMGLLKNYEVVNPFISATNDSLNRLKPGFEAPVCIVTSLGHSPEAPSRNRTVLAGLVRDVNSPLATRFEVRSPNPYTNTYIAVSTIYLTMLDGIKAVVDSGKSSQDLEMELSKASGTPGFYLENDREYRSENDVFDDFNVDKRDRLFGKPPTTVWENMQQLKHYPDKLSVIKSGNIFRQELIDAFVSGVLNRWKVEIMTRIIPDNIDVVKACICLHDGETANDLDLCHWKKVSSLKEYLAKNSLGYKSLFARIIDALVAKDYEIASKLQIEMNDQMSELHHMYDHYRKNIIHHC